MDRQVWLCTAVLMSLFLAGCSGSKANQAGPATEDDSATKGTISGLVTDDESQPLEGVSISIKAVKVSPISIKVVSDATGRFTLTKVPAGKQTVLAEKDNYNDASTTITIIPGVDTTVRLIMAMKPVTVYSIVAGPHLTGQFTCAAEYWAGTGPCDYEIYNHTTSYPPTWTNNHTFAVPAGWGGLLFQVKWQAGQGYYEGIRFQIESQEDIGGMFVKADGTQSPMRIQINAGQVAPDATLGYPIPQRGVKTWIHVNPLGYYNGATCAAACGYGFGVAADLKYDVYITEFFGGPVDDNYSAFTEG